ncbi:MAG: fimbrial biogenesis chaperone [Gammaproteobacteria bacterium]
MFALRSVIPMFLLITGFISSTLAMGAAKLAVSPVQLILYPNAKTGVVNLINKGEKPVHLQIYAKTWDMDENGKFIQAETGEFIFYPKILTIEPNKQGVIRVGYSGEFPESEKPFRVIIEEIPEIIKAEPEKNKTKFGVTSALRLSMPLYVVPVNNIPPVQVKLEQLKTDQNILRVGVKNLTVYHVDLKKVSATLFKQDKILVEKSVELSLQRVLGVHLVFVNLPIDVTKFCSQADAIAITIEATRLAEPYQTKATLKQGCQLLQ